MTPTLLVTAVLAAVVAGAVACADFTSTPDPTGGLPDVLIEAPSFVTDIQPIFTKRCAQAGCHTPASAQAGLVLSEGQSYNALVRQPATLAPQYLRVNPGDHASSWLWRMLQGDSTLRPGYPQMPLAATPLTPNQLGTVANWIDEGAPSQ